MFSPKRVFLGQGNEFKNTLSASVPGRAQPSRPQPLPLGSPDPRPEACLPTEPREVGGHAWALAPQGYRPRGPLALLPAVTSVPRFAEDPPRAHRLPPGQAHTPGWTDTPRADRHPSGQTDTLQGRHNPPGQTDTPRADRHPQGKALLFALTLVRCRYTAQHTGITIVFEGVATHTSMCVLMSVHMCESEHVSVLVSVHV